MGALVHSLDDDREGCHVLRNQHYAGEGICDEPEAAGLAMKVVTHPKAFYNGDRDLPVSKLPGYAAREGITANRPHTEGIVADDTPCGGLDQDVRDRHSAMMVMGSSFPEIMIQLWYTARKGAEIMLLFVEYLGVVIAVRHRA